VTGPELVRDLPPVATEVAGRTVVLHYGDPLGEYAALRTSAMLVDRGARGRMRIEGPKSAEMLQGLVTNDVQALTPGRGLYAAALTPKGKIVADVRIFALQGAYLIDAPPRAHEGWMATVRKFVNPRWAPFRELTGELADLGVYGPDARRIVAAVTGIENEALAALPPYGHLPAAGDGAQIIVARVPDLEVDGYELFLPHEECAAVRARLLAAGATPGGQEAMDIARVEGGRPEWGLDMDDATIPQEANLDELHAISYTKGCYTGQEVVARVHFRGHVNRHLRGLLFADGGTPRSGATLHLPDGKAVGDVRSVVLSPRLGTIALGMVRREVEPGTALTARWDGGEARADVVRLPFPTT
jgi:folate-binding protein YgfZ